MSRQGKPNNSNCMASCATMTAAASAILAFWLTAEDVARLKLEYIAAHQLRPRLVEGFFGTSELPPTVTIEMIGWDKVLFSFMVVFLIAAIVYPIVGRLVAGVGEELADCIDSVFRLEEKERIGAWSHDASMMFGTLWPITSLALLVWPIGVMIGKLYRGLWH